MKTKKDKKKIAQPNILLLRIIERKIRKKTEARKFSTVGYKSQG